ncbi:alpha-E domain-containing protein [Primorskyibacter sedentarius]|uniref:alpha-E domain-containing protein n=1 Tax=Primorskyibacter sedentarius TaxID=745311 RepID=UPI003EBCF656
MLSRTAANLYWIARYMERAEMTARMLEVGSRNALLPNIGDGYRNEWSAILETCGATERFTEKFGEPVQHNIETFLFFDLGNPSSIASCISIARENARVVRTALTSLVWDVLNSAFQELNQMRRTERSKLPLSDLIDWTVKTCALVRGAIESTQLRNDGFYFTQLGYAVERADNTARLLDVKYYVLLPGTSYIGSGLDTYQWTTLLRALSASRAFNWTYKGELNAQKVAHFVILNQQSPRSLLSCARLASDHLDHLSRGYGTCSTAQTCARSLVAELAEAGVQDIFDEGLHEFLTRFILEIGKLDMSITDNYLRGEF